MSARTYQLWLNDGNRAKVFLGLALNLPFRIRVPLSPTLTSRARHTINTTPIRVGSFTTWTQDNHDTYAVCRTLPALSCLPDKKLKNAINDSIEIYLPELEAFDRALPAHFHRKSKAAWFEFTCATFHLCDLISNFCPSK
jgi:hypothetical protein